VAGIAGAVGAACGTVPDTSPVPATRDSLATGARLYQNNCQVCHGPDGRGSALAADLTLHIFIRTDGFLFSRMSEGFPTDSDQKTMPAFKDQLTETERWHLVNFLRETFRRRAPVLPEEMSQ
jgi:cytochrome c